MTNHEPHETEAQSELKQEIADYLGMNHGGYEEDSELDCIVAAEHIVTKLAEPHLREMIAQEIRAEIKRQGNPDHRDLNFYLEGLGVAALIAKGPQQ